MTVKTDVTPITAFRLELLNDPNLPLGGPGRSIKGTAALTEFKVEAAPADAPGKASTVKFVAGHGRRQPARDAARPDLRRQERQEARHRAGRLRHRRQGRDGLGHRRRPGRRNQPRKAVFTAEKPIAFPGGTILTFRLTQNHGGWNSDDNQNHNLGRFRLSITTAADAVGRPAAAGRPRDPGDPAREADRRPGRPPSSATGGRRSRTGRRPTTGSRRSGASIPRAPRNWCSPSGRERRPTHVLQRGDFLKPAKPVEPGVPSFLNPLPAGLARRPGWTSPGGWSTADRRPRRDRSSTGSGRPTSAPGSSRPARTSACSASRRRIPSCSTGWPSSSWTAAGA